MALWLECLAMDQKLLGSKLDHVGRHGPRLTHSLKGYLASLREVSSGRLAACPGGGFHLFDYCYRKR